MNLAIGALILAVAASAEPSLGARCGELEARIHALERAALQCSSGGQPCAAPAAAAQDLPVVPGSCVAGPAPQSSPTVVTAESLRSNAAELRLFVAGHCPQSCLGAEPKAAVTAPAPLRPHGAGPSLQRLIAMAAPAGEGSDEFYRVSGAWGVLRPSTAARPRFQTVQFGMPSMPSLPPQLPQQLTVPSLTPSLGAAGTLAAPPVARAPEPAPVAVAQPARAAPPATVASPLTDGGSSDGGDDPRKSPCDDLREKARRLRSAAAQCDADVAAGAPYCNVTVTFSRPSLPKTISPGAARGYADDFERWADVADQGACIAHGGEGPDLARANAASVRRAQRHYSELCSQGDEYACSAQQITTLCFGSSPVNTCVRNCLVDNDAECSSISDEGERLDCRRRAHYQCYYATCPKFMPTWYEYKCFSQFPHWKEFLCPPGMPTRFREMCQ